MRARRPMRFLIAPIIVILATAGSVYGAYTSARDGSRSVPQPDVRDAKGKHCVQPTAVMLRDHMVFLLHQRFVTVHDGIHATRYSLIHCVNCHANPVTHSVLGKNGFCESCHTYNAVSISCFSCHSPSPSQGTPGPNGVPNGVMESSLRQTHGTREFGTVVAQASVHLADSTGTAARVLP
ncbi:MAG: hypothetical protein ACYDDA_08605 [Acidiferrobacteraceae bacterium]